jgi:transposase
VCKGTLEEMGELTEDAEEVTVEKRRFVVVRHKRHKYRCRCNAVVKTAPGPLRLIPGGRYSLDFAIALEIDKRLNHLPLDRQRRQMAREGLVISTQTMWDQEEALADLLEPSYLKLLAYILGDDVIGADETHWRLMQPGSSTKWWVWCLTTHDAAWYMLEPSRSAETIRGVLGDFEGVVACDAYAAYPAVRHILLEHAQEGPIPAPRPAVLHGDPRVASIIGPRAQFGLASSLFRAPVLNIQLASHLELVTGAATEFDPQGLIRVVRIYFGEVLPSVFRITVHNLFFAERRDMDKLGKLRRRSKFDVTDQDLFENSL